MGISEQYDHRVPGPFVSKTRYKRINEVRVYRRNHSWIRNPDTVLEWFDEKEVSPQYQKDRSIDKSREVFSSL